MAFCRCCAAPLIRTVPPGDHREREVCSACGMPYYENPRILVACLVHCGGRVLWIRRGHAPRAGFWGLPAGFMEKDESLQQAAARELREETGLAIDPDDLQLYVLGTLTYMNEVYVLFRVAHPLCALTPPSDEVLEVGFFSEEDAPWAQLAFPTTESAIRCFYREVKAGQFGVYLGEYTREREQIRRMGAGLEEGEVPRQALPG